MKNQSVIPLLMKLQFNLDLLLTMAGEISNDINIEICDALLAVKWIYLLQACKKTSPAKENRNNAENLACEQ